LKRCRPGDERDSHLFAVPFGKVEAAVGVILAPGVKIRGSGGFDFPGYTMFSITGVFLFGAR
jgi:hypothetical protein